MFYFYCSHHIRAAFSRSAAGTQFFDQHIFVDGFSSSIHNPQFLCLEGMSWCLTRSFASVLSSGDRPFQCRVGWYFGVTQIHRRLELFDDSVYPDVPLACFYGRRDRNFFSCTKKLGSCPMVKVACWYVLRYSKWDFYGRFLPARLAGVIPIQLTYFWGDTLPGWEPIWGASDTRTGWLFNRSLDKSHPNL